MIVKESQKKRISQMADKRWTLIGKQNKKITNKLDNPIEKVQFKKN